jgi:hypothetical protein
LAFAGLVIVRRDVMAVRSSDPLTAATTSILIPELRSHGFRRKTNRIIARIQDDILQFFDLQLSAYGGKNFCVNYASISLFCPRDYLILQPGARLKRANGADAWLPAKTHEDADASMAQVANMARTQALPFFDATKSADGLLGWLKRENWGSRHHLYLEMAFCEAWLGRISEAKAHALRAIELYREDSRDWCPEYIDLCEQLIAGIESNNSTERFQHWIEHSDGKLGLSRIRA